MYAIKDRPPNSTILGGRRGGRAGDLTEKAAKQRYGEEIWERIAV